MLPEKRKNKEIWHKCNQKIRKNKEKIKRLCEIVINFTRLFLRLSQKAHQRKEKKQKQKKLK